MTDLPSLGPGSIFGRYRILRQLGEGWLGALYEAEKIVIQHRVALRVVRSEFAANSLFARMTSVASIRNEHIAEIYEFGEISGVTFVTTEYLSGFTLSEIARRRGSLAISEAVSIALQACRGVAAAHRVGVVHGSLSLESVIITRNFDSRTVCKIIDWERPAPGESPGSALRDAAPYISPDTWRSGKAPERHDDVYALGVVLYKLLSGRYPYEASSAIALAALVLTEGPARLDSIRPDVPSSLAGVVHRALANEVSQRFSHAGELADALEPFERTIDPEERATSTFWPRNAIRPKVDEGVQISVYRPKVITAGRWYKMLALAHLTQKRPGDPSHAPAPLEEVERRAREFAGGSLEDYHHTAQDTLAAVPEAGAITFVPAVDGIEFSPPTQSFVWHDAVHGETFALRVTNASRLLPGAVARGHLVAYVGAILLADVPLSFTIGDTEVLEPTQSSANAYRKIFASYSRKDADIVAQFEAFAKAMGDQYLIDVRDLRSGENWTSQLERLIRGADVFQLFWSSSSMHSKFCRREWEFALGLGKESFVRPVFWEEPMPRDDARDLPPPKLARLHFARLPARWLGGLQNAFEGTSEAAAGSVAMKTSTEVSVASAAHKVSRSHRTLALLSMAVVGTAALVAHQTFAPVAGINPPETPDASWAEPSIDAASQPFDAGLPVACTSKESRAITVRDPRDNPRNRAGWPRIVGGRPSDVTSAVAITTAGTRRTQYCGGSLIAPEWVLTAAHCEVQRGDKVIVGNRYSNGAGGKVLEVTSVRNHALFDPESMNHDVAILKLAEAVSDSTPIGLYEGSNDLAGYAATVVGWGFTQEGGPASAMLLEVEVPILPNAVCRAAYANDNITITSDMLCAGVGQGGKDGCQGDSGGSLSVKVGGEWRQAGIVSFGVGCARPNKYAIHTRVANYVPWIHACTK